MSKPDAPKYVVHSAAEPFDFVEQRKITKPLLNNGIEATAHLIKACLGGGILGVHEAYMKCGLWASLFFNLLFGFYVAYCVHMLINSAQILYKRLHLTHMSYPDVAEAALGTGPFPNLRKYSKMFRYAVDIAICIQLFGACVVYEIIIAKTIQQVVGTADAQGISSLRLYICYCFLPVVLLCMITSLKYLAPFSILANGFIVVCVTATIVYGKRSAPKLSTMPAWKDIIGFIEFCGVVVFSMDGFGVCLPIENNMKEPMKFPLVVCAGFTVVVSFVALVGFFGYWGFGEECISPVTLNFPKETFPTILKVLMGLMIFMTLALNFWAPFNLVWYYVSRKYDPNKFWFWERVYRALIILIITCLAIAFPNIGSLMGLLGAFCVSNMGFIFPPIIETLVVWEEPGLGAGKWRLWKNILVLTVGLLLFVFGTCTNAVGLAKSLKG